jgi:protein tyrosine/serine phosphatase
MSPATVFGIISFLLMLGGGYLTIRDSIANLSRAQETQIADLRRAQEMQRVQLESLIKTVISQGKTP